MLIPPASLVGRMPRSAPAKSRQGSPTAGRGTLTPRDAAVNHTASTAICHAPTRPPRPPGAPWHHLLQDLVAGGYIEVRNDANGKPTYWPTPLAFDALFYPDL